MATSHRDKRPRWQLRLLSPSNASRNRGGRTFAGQASGSPPGREGDPIRNRGKSGLAGFSGDTFWNGCQAQHLQKRTAR
ncbi:hypothetical protein AGOR_G00042310 [Albula goreensis]|uniref:Uncharacterized protein n=1 Tax=Albula goreensis TaxID=1534307 RepID=A0A8T3E2I5_9TELE|nr:hypothetical protein AGOR_G00042310 [Albula goreensis]